MKALVLVSNSPGKSFEVQKRVKGIKGVDRALVVAGRADVAVFAKGSLKEIGAVVKSIWSVRGVTSTETLMEVV